MIVNQELLDFAQKIEDLHKPIERTTSTGTSTYCDFCSHILTFACPEYVHLIEYPCRTVEIVREYL